MSSFPYRHICVIGTSGTGKTTLARELAKRIGGEHIELDSLFHGPNWQPTTLEVFHERASERMRGERWVVDGNYFGRSDHLRNADLIIWLDYPFRTVLRRATVRTLRRLITKEELWNGNRETWRMAVSREGIVAWVFKTYRRRRRELPTVLGSPPLQDIPQLRFRYPRELRAWVRTLQVSMEE